MKLEHKFAGPCCAGKIFFSVFSVAYKRLNTQVTEILRGLCVELSLQDREHGEVVVVAANSHALAVNRGLRATGRGRQAAPLQVVGVGLALPSSMASTTGARANPQRTDRVHSGSQRTRRT
jgi:hypothetical protein